jgi:hypothetical protein
MSQIHWMNEYTLLYIGIEKKKFTQHTVDASKQNKTKKKSANINWHIYKSRLHNLVVHKKKRNVLTLHCMVILQGF